MADEILATAPILRFAPSPNGALHLGHAYSALMNERIAAETKGRVLLRIEDLDRTRCKPQFETAIVDDLAWLGLRFPAPRRQSEHGDDYAAALARLDQRGLVYPCFCSRSEIALVSKGRRDPDGAPLYAGTCRALSRAEARDRVARGDKAAFRLDMRRAVDAGPARLSWTEYGEGAVPSQPSAAPEVWGDVVLRGRDLAASYHLAVVVDDALQGVTDVVGDATCLRRPRSTACCKRCSALPSRAIGTTGSFWTRTGLNYRKAVSPGRWPNCARQAWRRAEFGQR
jgi:glutamyl-Q tRNA(Asp) synthetase